MESITLTKPFMLQNGNEITELKLDFASLSAADFRQISKLEAMLSDNTDMGFSDIFKSKSISFEFQFASGFLAATKATEGLQISDFLKIPMQDALEIATIASFFWLRVD